DSPSRGTCENHPVTVRPATTDDLAALSDLAALTFPLACPPDMPEADMTAFIAANLSSDRFRDHLADATAEVLVAHDADALTGYTLTFDAEPHRVELSKCYTHP